MSIRVLSPITDDMVIPCEYMLYCAFWNAIHVPEYVVPFNRTLVDLALAGF